MDPTQQLGAMANSQLQGAVGAGPDVNQSLGVALGSGGVPTGVDGGLPNQNANSASSLDGDGDLGSDAEALENDAEGVWAPDIEQAFQEALAIYPPCGRRKIILSDEGKMYGRNELIARYIKLRTAKVRTRKQVSSHIQVLARKKAREIQGKIKDQAAKDKVMAGISNMSSAQIVSASAIQNRANAAMFGGTPGIAGSAIPMHNILTSPGGIAGNPVVVKQELLQNPAAGLLQVAGAAGPFIAAVTSPVGNQSMSPSFTSSPRVGFPFVIANQGDSPIHPMRVPNLPLRMVEFYAFVDQSKQENKAANKKQHMFVNIEPTTNFTDPNMEAVDIRHIAEKFPEKNGGLKELFEKGPQDRFFLVKFWADINTALLDDSNAFYGVTSQYESQENMTISCSTKVCSFGKQVVEKVETEYARFDQGRFVYRINRSTMCDYMVSFIHRLKHLPEKYMMNSVLENFTILQVVTNRETQETLLCLAYVFEICTADDGPKHRVYRLIKEN